MFFIPFFEKLEKQWNKNSIEPLQVAMKKNSKEGNRDRLLYIIHNKDTIFSQLSLTTNT